MKNLFFILAVILVGCGSQLVEFELDGGSKNKQDASVDAGSDADVVDASADAANGDADSGDFCGVCRAVCGTQK